MNRRIKAAVSGLAAVTLLLAGCNKPSSTSSSSVASTSAASASAAAPSAAVSAAATSAAGSAATSVAAGAIASSPAVTSAAVTGKKLSIGFFGFAKANSFASATYAGISEYAAAHNATSEFLDPNFDAQVQVQQLQDAVTSKRFGVIVVQANDGTAVVPAVKQALAAGITVVVEFTPVGTRYDTAEPQVPGVISVVDVPTVNGAKMATLGLQACKSVAASPCKVAYLQGFKSLPLDNARTNATVTALKAGGAQVVANVEGGYTADSGRQAFQNVLQANPDVNVVIGSSQAIEGASALAAGKKIAFIGNGGSVQAFAAVESGKWFAAYVVPEKTEGAKAAELGLTKARGGTVPVSTNALTLTSYGALGTKAALAGQKAEYSD